MSARVLRGDILSFCRHYHGPLAHAILCDPPYHLTTIVNRFGKDGSAPAQYGRDGAFSRLSAGFMNQKWDGGDLAFRSETWAALHRVLYPGAFGIAFGGSRTAHRVAVAIEDAGFIIHPTVYCWLNGQGFPKATRIDRQLPGEPVPTGHKRHRNVKPYDDDRGWNANATTGDYEYTQSSNPLAQAWAGHRYGLQALKPAVEPIIVFQKPYAGRPVDDITATGAGAINVDAGRIGTDDNSKSGRWPANFALVHDVNCVLVGYAEDDGYTINRFTDGAKPWGQGAGHPYESDPIPGGTRAVYACVPACPVRRLDEQSGILTSGKMVGTYWGFGTTGIYGQGGESFRDSGGASRFFHTADWNLEAEERLFESDPVKYEVKASRGERNAGLGGTRNHHPTVKPIALNRWLATLLLPPAEYAPRRLLVPFAGSGSEMIGGLLAGWDEVVGVELEREYIPLAEARLRFWAGWSPDPGRAKPTLKRRSVKPNDPAAPVSLLDYLK